MQREWHGIKLVMRTLDGRSIMFLLAALLPFKKKLAALLGVGNEMVEVMKLVAVLLVIAICVLRVLKNW